MEGIKKKLTEDYTSSVNFFNKGDFKHFLKDARNCIEWIFKYMIHEIIGSPQIADQLITGKNDFVKDQVTNNYRLTGRPQSENPEGTHFAWILKRAIYYKYPVLQQPSDKSTKRLKKYVETAIDQMTKFYSVASELSEHTGSSNLDIIKQSKQFAGNFSTFGDDVKQLFPKTKQLLDSFPTFDIASVEPSIHSINEDLKTLYNATGGLCAEGGSRFIVLLPSETSEIDSNLAESLFMIPCSLVCEFGRKEGNDTSSRINPNSWSQKVHPIRSKDDFIVGRSMLNWFFCHGETGVGESLTYDFKNWKVSRGKLFVDILTNVVKKENTSHFYILNFIDEPKYAPYIFNCLSQVFGDEECVQNRCDIFSFTKNKDIQSGIKEWHEDSIVNHSFMHVSFADFLLFIEEKTKENKAGVSETLLKKKISFTQDEIIRYHEAGIDIFGQYVPNREAKWNFYYGAEITWNELAADYDVKRIGYEKFKQNIISIISKPRQKTFTYTLKHHPGAGGTTMSRRLAFDICRLSSESDTLTCLPVFLNAYNEKTYEYILHLSEKKLDNEFVLIIVEGGKVADENINKLTLRLNSRQRNVLVLRIFRTTKKQIQGGTNITTLPSLLSAEDAELFIKKYSAAQNGVSKPLFQELDIQKGVEVVDFPLKLHDDITSNRLDDYVSAFMDDMSASVKEFCGYVAFAAYYSDRALNHNLINNCFSACKFSLSDRVALEKLLIEEVDEDGQLSGCWRPRYQSFALPILHKVWGQQWRLSVTKIAVDFLKECRKVGTIGQYDKDLLYGIFILRRGADFKDSLDESKAKFAKLIQDILFNEQRPEEIYNTLVSIYPDDPIFLGHYGRYLFEQAYSKQNRYDDELYIRAEKFILDAIGQNPNVDDNHHMKGMLYLRKIQSLKTSMSSLRKEASFDFYFYDDILQKWMLAAEEGFERSIDINPASPYGYTARCQLYMECLKVAQKARDTDDFTFCEKGPMYLEICDSLASSLDQLGNLCRTYDESLTYMGQSIRIYNQIRAFHRQMIGDPQAAADYYKKLFDTCNSNNKIFYGRQFITSILYARTDGLRNNMNKNNTVWAMSRLNNKDRDDVSRVLNYQRTQCDVESYENIFWFKMSSNEDFPLEEAVNLLIEWLKLYEENGKTGGGKLKAMYYLAVCYSAMAINSGTYCDEYVKKAEKYFKEASFLAETFERHSLYAFSYMGDDTDAHCILQPSQIDEALVIEAVISKIEKRKGYVKLSCGLEAFFPAHDFEYLKDVGKTYLRGKIGFRYGGLGLYQFERVTENSVEQINEICERIDNAEKNIELSIESDKILSNNIKQDEVYKTETENSNAFNIKPVGKIDLDSLNPQKRKSGIKHGVFHKGKAGNPDKITDDITGYSCEVRSIINGEELYDEDKVNYKLKSEPHKSDPTRKYYFAIDVMAYNES